MKNRLVMPLSGDRVPVEARDAGGWKRAMQLLLHALRTQPHEVDVLAGALGAHAGDLLGVAAVVAQQAAGALVERQRQRTFHARAPPPEGAARHETGEP